MESSSSGRPKLPDDFVEKQRAYFQEIDAFELPEEEASETDWPASKNQAYRSIMYDTAVQKCARSGYFYGITASYGVGTDGPCNIGGVL